MSRSRRALVTVAVLFCLATATSLVAQEFVRITTLAGAEKSRVLKDPRAVAVDLPSGVLFIADRNHHQVVALDPTGAATVIAGGNPGRMDGEGVTAQFNSPEGIAVDSARRVIYVADTKNHLIRRVTFDGMVNTLAGSGQEGDGDGIGTEASFKQPAGLALDAVGNLYVADSGNHKIRMVTPFGTVTTRAGTGHPDYSDGTAAHASFREPRGIAVSASGEIYVADTKNHVIRRIAGRGVWTVAGTAGHAGSADGPPTVAEFREPSGLAFDAAAISGSRTRRTIRCAGSAPIRSRPPSPATAGPGMSTPPI